MFYRHLTEAFPGIFIFDQDLKLFILTIQKLKIKHMKSVILKFFVSMSLIFTLSVSEALPENAAAHFYLNPLLLNGKSVDFSIFSLVSTGMISLAGNPDSELKTKIPFYISIKRSGKVVEAYSNTHHHAITEVNMAEILR